MNAENPVGNEAAKIGEAVYAKLEAFGDDNHKNVGQIMIMADGKMTMGTGTLIAKKDDDNFVMLTSATALWPLKDANEKKGVFYLQKNE